MIQNDWGWRYLDTLAWVYMYRGVFVATTSLDAWFALLGAVIFFPTAIKVWLVPLGKPLIGK